MQIQNIKKKELLNIKWDGLAASTNLQEKLEHEFEKLKGIHDQITSVNVIVKKDKNDAIIEARVHIHNKEMFAEARDKNSHTQASADPFKCALDDLIAKLKIQLSKHKEKLKDHHVPSAHEVAEILNKDKRIVDIDKLKELSSEQKQSANAQKK